MQAEPRLFAYYLPRQSPSSPQALAHALKQHDFNDLISNLEGVAGELHATLMGGSRYLCRIQASGHPVVAARCVKAYVVSQSGRDAPASVSRVRICSSTPFVPRPIATSLPSAPAMKCVGHAVAP